MKPRASLLLAIAAALAAFTLLLYLPTFRYDFIRYDDPNYVWLHPRISQGLSWDNLRWSLTAFEVGNWHPLTLISHMTDVSLFGLRPGAHHLVNAVLHAADVALLFVLFAAATRRLWPAAAAAVLFAIHPLNVESVAWISQRKSVLAMFFLLLAMNVYVDWTRRGGAFRYGAALVAFGAALASKPMVVVAPGLLLLLDAWPLGRLAGATPARRLRCAGLLLLEKLPWCGLAAGSAVVTMIAQREGGAMAAAEGSATTARLANVLFAYAWYPFRMVWPIDLSLFYPTSLGPPVSWRLTGAGILLLGLASLAIALVRRAPYVAFGVAWYAIALVPVAGFVPFGTQIVADRYAYLSLIGLFVALAYGGADFVTRSPRAIRRLAVALGPATVIALVVAQQGALVPWRDSESVLQRGVRRAPNNPHALTNLGLLLVAEDRLDEGIAMLKRAEVIVPLFPPIHAKLGYAYERQGRLMESRAHYEEALRLGDDDPAIVLELAHVLANLGDIAGAEARLREAVAVDSEPGRALLQLGTLLLATGRAEEALPLLEQAVAREPDNAKARTALGLALEAGGRREEALESLREAVRLDPTFARARAELGRIEAGRPPPTAGAGL